MPLNSWHTLTTVNKKKETRRKDKGKAQRKRKGLRQSVKPPIPSWAINAIVGEEHYRILKKEKSKKKGARIQPSYTGPFGCLL